MYTKEQIEKFLFIDIETVSGEKDLDTLRSKNEKLAKLWDKRTEYLRERYPDNLLKTNEEIYEAKAGLHSEYGKIICITLGSLKTDGTISVKSFYGDDEKELLENTLQLIEKFFNKVGGLGRIVGHNIKRFDIPVICKRAIINRIPVPEIFQLHKLKPWEYPIVDTSDLWSHGAWQESFAPLDLLCSVLEVPSPKVELDGSMVQETYYKKDGLKEIVSYCELDVVATINVLLRLGNMDPIDDFNSK